MMSNTTLSFSCALITGGGGGIGKTLATNLITQGKKVIIAGRTESNLRETAHEIGAAAYYVLDTGVVDSFPSFIAQIIHDHPDLDCLINNAGVQRPLDLVNDQPDSILERADNEININIRGPMHLTLHLLEHFRTKPSALIVNVSSILAFVPFAPINPVYSGTKAWLHFWSMNLRTQLQGAGCEKIRVVEIAPPTVTTNLHREREDPGDNEKSKNPNALSLEDFMAEVEGGLRRGDEVIAPGMSGDLVERWYGQFGEFYNKMTA